jgi:hypothetical protein
MKLDITWDTKALADLEKVPAAVGRALRKAGATALRDMRGTASKRIRARKALKAGTVSKAIQLQSPKGNLLEGQWVFRMTGLVVPLIAYPHRLRTQRVTGADGKVRKRKVLEVEVNKGVRSLVPGAFVATMKSGHEGIFKRLGKERLPIKELLGSRPVDALLHQGEAQAVADRGGKSFADTFARLLPLELAKDKGK